MKHLARWVLAGLTLLVCLAPGFPAGDNDALPVRKVILYKDGVGYFVRTGKVPANQPVTLHFKADQMNDLLMSLTALDLGGGQISSVTYDSTNTVAKLLSQYTFDLKEVTGLADLLPQLKGAKVQIKIGPATLSGAVIGVQAHEIKVDQTVITQYRLTLMTDDGLVKSVNLADAESVQFTDPKLQAEIGKYLEILFSQHKKEEKTLTLTATGQGERELLVAYVVETPVWKVTYRLVMDREHPAEPLLQGWAIVDNVSEEDWKDVELTLVAGLPVSFVQDLYNPWWKKRPVVQIEEEVAVGPRMYEAGFGGAGGGAKGVEGEQAAASELKQMTLALPAAAPSAARPEALRRALSADMLQAQEKQLAQTVTREVGDLFQYSIDHAVTIERDRSALIPIANARVKGRTVSIYNESQRAKNPMSAVHLENTTALTLEGGPLTVLADEAFAGAALMDTLKAGEKRYVAYAVDLGTRVTTKFDSSNQSVFRVLIDRGTMYMYYRQLETKTYTLDNVDNREKTVIVEHPLRADYKLIAPEKPLEKTENYYRFEVKVPAKGTAALAVKEERQLANSYAVSNITSDQIVFFARQKYLDPETQKFLEEVVALKAKMVTADRQLQDLDRQYQESVKKQQLLSTTLKSLGESTQEKALRDKYVGQLETELDRMNKLETQINALRDQRRKMQEDLDGKVGGFQKQYNL